MKRFSLILFIPIIVFYLFLVAEIFVPQQVNAGSLLLIDCKSGPLIKGTNEHECGFPDVIAEIKQLMDFAFMAAVPITIIAVTWAGIQILLAQGNTGKVSDAKKLATQVLTGFIFVLSAWLIVYVISSQLLKPEFYQFLGGRNSPTAVQP